MKADLQTHKVHGNKSASFFGKTGASSAFFQPAVIQPQLTINEPGDKYEQEADAMAERVMRMETASGAPTDEEQPIQTMPLAISRLQRQESEEEEPVQMMPLSIQRKCAECEQEEQLQRQEMPEEEAIQTKGLSIQRQQDGPEEEMLRTMPLAIQRKCAACEAREREQVQAMPLMRKSDNGGYQATPRLTSQLSQSKGGGNPLPMPTLNYMNQAFGADFSKVRVHTGSQAQEMSQGIQAKAFTHGSDVYFNRGQYSPESSDGKRLLAHELTHVVQQGGDKPEIQKNGDGATPQPSLTPQELFDIITTQRAFTFNPGNRINLDPAGVGRGVGPAAGGRLAGHSVFAVIQITDAAGNHVITAYGQHVYYSDAHAERSAIRGLERHMPSGINIRGGQMVVVVDQTPCTSGPNCDAHLRDYAQRNGMGLRVLVPQRTAGRAVAPRTAARGSQRTDMPTVRLAEIVNVPGPLPTVVSTTPTPVTPAAGQASGPGRTRGPQRGSFRDRARPAPPYQGPSIGGRGRSQRVSYRGQGLAVIVPAATNAFQDLSIRHGVATRMLGQWSSVERIRRDHPDHVIMFAVSLYESEIATEGMRSRGINYVTLYHGASQEEAMDRHQDSLHASPPSGFVEVGPFLGFIEPSLSLETARDYVESQEACFIITASYGSTLMPQVHEFRQFREAYLRKSLFGRAFISGYYQLSPPIAKFLFKHPAYAFALRVVLLNPILPLVKFLNRINHIISNPFEHRIFRRGLASR